MILTERTAQIAAVAPHGKDPASGMKAPKRLLLDRVHSKPSNDSVVTGIYFSVPAYSAAAEAGHAVSDFTVPKTDIASCHTSVLSDMAYHFKTLQGHFFATSDSGFLTCNGNLLFNGIHTFEVRQKQSSSKS